MNKPGTEMNRRTLVTGLGAAAAGAGWLPTRAGRRTATVRRLRSTLAPVAAAPLTPVPTALKYRRLGPADFRPPDSGIGWQLAGGALQATASARFTASFSPGVRDQLTELVLFIDPAGQAGSIRLTAHSPGVTTDLAVGNYAATGSATTVYLPIPGQPLYTDPETSFYSVAVDLNPGASLFGARIDYFSASATIVMIEPVRVWDSRTEQGALLVPGAHAGGRLATGNDLGFTLDGVVPRISYGPILNVTIDQTQGSGYLVVWAKGEDGTPPPTSNLNWYGPNQIAANLVVTKMAGEADVTITAGGNGSTHVIVDVIGYLV